MFACYAAYIRGAIAFGLSQNLQPEHFGHEDLNKAEVDVVQNGILSLVILTTVLIGGATPMVQRCLLPKEEKISQEQGHGDTNQKEIRVSDASGDGKSENVLPTNSLIDSGQLLP